MSENPDQSKKVIAVLIVVLAAALSAWWFLYKNTIQPAGGNLPPPTPEAIFIPDFLDTLSGIVVRRDALSLVMQVRILESADGSKFHIEERTVRWTDKTSFKKSSGYPNDKTPQRVISASDVKLGDSIVATASENIRDAKSFTATSVVDYAEWSGNPVGGQLGSGPVPVQITTVNGAILSVNVQSSEQTIGGSSITVQPPLLAPGAWTVRLTDVAVVNRVENFRPKKSSSSPPPALKVYFATPAGLKIGLVVRVFIAAKDDAKRQITSNRVDIIGLE